MKSLVQQFRPVLSLPKAAGAEADADFAGVATGEPSPVAIRALLPGDVGAMWDLAGQAEPPGVSPEPETSNDFNGLPRWGGWGTWIRTKAFRVRVGSSTAKLSPNQRERRVSTDPRTVQPP